MAKVGLSSVINASFINSFTGLAKKQAGSSGSSLASALSGSGSQVTISSGLRFGAQTFGRAVQGLNSGISYLNLTRGTLTELNDVTEKLIGIAERSAKASTSDASRKKLDVQFGKLITEFQQIVDKAKAGDRELAKLDDLSQVLVTLGLDPETSNSIKAIFDKFSLSGKDDYLASETTKGAGSPLIPPNAFVKGRTIDNTLTQISNATNAQTGAIATGYSVYQSEVAGVQTISIYNGTSTNTLSTTTGATLLAVNETSGYSLIQSSDDYLGTNPGLQNELFLVDNTGNVVHQYTNTGQTYTDADLSADNLNIIYTTGPNVYHTEAANLGDAPGVQTHTLLENIGLGDVFVNTRINNAGTYLTYTHTSGSVYDARFMDTATFTDDASFSGSSNFGIGFINDDRLAILQGNGPDITVSEYSYGSAVFNTIYDASGISPLGTFTTLERGSYATGFFGFLDTDPATDRFSLYDENGVRQDYYDFGGTDVPTDFSLARNSSGYAEVGIFGQVPSVASDADNELYRFTASQTTKYYSSLTDYESVFETTPTISTRPDAYRALHDLKALHKQIEDNLEAINYATETLQDNIELVRAAGFAFLELSDSIKDTEKAEEVATKLRDLIRKAPAAALAQAENLQPVAVAALALDEDSLLN